MNPNTVHLVMGLLGLGSIAGIAAGISMCFSAETRDRGCYIGIWSAIALIATANIGHAILH